MAATLAQKLIARAAGRSHVTPGEIVTCRVDVAMFHDSSGPRRLQPMLAELGAREATTVVTVAASIELTIEVTATDQADADASDNRVVTTITVQAP